MTATRQPHPVARPAGTPARRPAGNPERAAITQIRQPVIDRDSATARLCAVLEKIDLTTTGPIDPEAFAALDDGADIDAQDSRGRSLLAHAICRTQAKTVESLLSRGADPNRGIANGVTPLMLATDRREVVTHGEILILSCLLAHGAAVNARRHARSNIGGSATSALTLALQCRRIDLAGMLLDQGADPNGPMNPGPDQISRSPLTWAVLTNNTAALDLLLARGADPNTPPDVDGLTPLRATRRSSTSVGPHCVRALIRHGADPASTTPFGYTLPWYFNIVHRVDLLEALDDVLTEPSCAAARHRLLDRLTVAQRHRWLPRSTAVEAASAIRHRWDRRP